MARRERETRKVGKGKRGGRREKFKKLQNRVKKGYDKKDGGGKSWLKSDKVKMWKPNNGEHIIDIIPYEAGKLDRDVGEGDPTYTLEVHVHRGVGAGEEWFVCPQEMANKPCPICEHRKKLRDQGADKEQWKQLFPKKRNLYNIVCYDSREERKKGVQVWDVPYFYFEKSLLAIAKKPQRAGSKGIDPFVPFSDPDDGKSIAFTIEKAKSQDDYPSYVGHAFEDRDYAIEDEILDQAVCLDELVIIEDYDTIDKAYWGESGGKEKAGRRGGKKKKAKAEADVEDLRNMLDEVQDLDDWDDLESYVEDNNIEIGGEDELEDEFDDEDELKEAIIERLEELIDEAEEEEEGEDDGGRRSRKRKSSGGSNECPEGGVFGKDNNEFDECEDCKLWRDCVKESKKKKKSGRSVKRR